MEIVLFGFTGQDILHRNTVWRSQYAQVLLTVTRGWRCGFRRAESVSDGGGTARCRNKMTIQIEAGGVQGPSDTKEKIFDSLLCVPVNTKHIILRYNILKRKQVESGKC